MAVDGQLAGLIGVADPIKATTPEAIRQLHRENIRIVMLTGDSRTTAQAVAGKLGIDDVIAEVLPEDKSSAVKRPQDEGRFVATAGHRTWTPGPWPTLPDIGTWPSRNAIFTRKLM